MAAGKFTMDVAETEAGLSAADAATAQQSGSSLKSLAIGGYTTTLLGAAIGARAMAEAQAAGRAAANVGSREFSISTVQSTEAGNSSVLTT
ncbi:hypothetical protein SKC41_30545 [Mycobacterium sp. 050128]|uniref:hypothetical protein n=1 Tax=Mycobacterium sp. 050128 TaxID=3096112 RepID=UPI002EDAA76F